jgi:hypothetical protein
MAARRSEGRLARRVAVAVLVACVGLAACRGDGGDGGGGLQRVREVTYPPDFHYITQREIRTTMDRLAVEIATLEAIMEKPGGPRPEDRQAVIESLERMEDLAAQLDQGDRSNHPRIEAEAPQLRADVRRALLAARTGSPNYYDTGRVVGACMYCHAPAEAPNRHEMDRRVVEPEPIPQREMRGTP